MSRRRLLATLLLIPLLGACSTSAAATAATIGPGKPVQLTVYGAASLKDVLAAVEVAYQAVVPGSTLTIAIDSSSTLRTQIEEGAPADVFLSADERNPQALVDASLSDGTAVAFARNLLTIIVPTDNPAGIATPADLAAAGVKIIAAGEKVPITTYAGQVIANLARDPTYPTGFAEAYAENVASKEENVKAVVAKIELGEGDAAIVYTTDAIAAAGVATVDIPARANVAATYAGVVVGASHRLAEAHAFLGWLVGPAGQATLAGFGFLPPS